MRSSVLDLLWSFERLYQSQDGNRLYGLTKSHLIRQDSIQIGLVELEEPVESLELVVLQLAKLDVRRSTVQLVDLEVVLLLMLIRSTQGPLHLERKLPLLVSLVGVDIQIIETPDLTTLYLT